VPTRLLREGILDSEGVNRLGWPAEVFYRRLMSVVDDFGRFDARPSVLRSRLYPLKLGTVSEADVSSWLAECERAGLVSRYTVNGREYLLFYRSGPARSKVSKFPEPPDDIRLPPQLASENICAQTQTDENVCAQTFADVPDSYSSSYSSSSAGSEHASSKSAHGASARSASRKTFVIPSVVVVAEFCREIGATIDPQRFVDYYAANGWKVGRHKMKDWQAAVRTWQKNEDERGPHLHRNGKATLADEFNASMSVFLGKERNGDS
jgi:hypothetical protein